MYNSYLSIYNIYTVALWSILFQVIATDGGAPPKSATASVALTVQDVNDNDPRFDPNQYEANLAEDEPPGTPVVTVIASDPDEDSR